MSSAPNTVEHEETDALRDEDLEDIFAAGNGKTPASGDNPDVVHVPVPTIQANLKKAEPAVKDAAPDTASAAAPAGPRPKIQISIGAAGAAANEKESTVSKDAARSKAARSHSAVRSTGVVGFAFKSFDTLLDLMNWPLRRLDRSLRNLVGAVAAVTCMTAGTAAFLGPKLFPRYTPEDMICKPSSPEPHAAGDATHGGSGQHSDAPKHSNAGSHAGDAKQAEPAKPGHH